jgi:Tfp pilus assembly protein FimT
VAERTPPVRSGQSLIGLLMVLLILTLLTAFAAPRVNLTRYRSDSMARRVAGVFQAAARTARQRRHDVIVRIDSVGRRVGVLDDFNGNGLRDAGESESWTELDATAELRDPPAPLTAAAPGELAATAGDAGHQVRFRARGGATASFVLYLTTDADQPTAWRAIQVTPKTAVVQLWRFDGTRWGRGRA